MANYAVGDIQGCFEEFEKGLKKINFDETKDYLWLSGDLVNRGPDSLKTLKKIYELRSRVHIVLGNHDLHFLARYFSNRKKHKNDTLDELLLNSDCKKFANFLIKQPFFFSKKINLKNGLKKKFLMVHAGLPHNLSYKECIRLNKMAQEFIQENPKKNLKKIFFITEELTLKLFL